MHDRFRDARGIGPPCPVPRVAPYARWYTDPGRDDGSRPAVRRRCLVDHPHVTSPCRNG
ncbi:hypothetical protein OH687_30150 [Burkholderia anthina]|nr:hypothetical protein OH687_30150 [Burkholderia anthina]